MAPSFTLSINQNLYNGQQTLQLLPCSCDLSDCTYKYPYVIVSGLTGLLATVKTLFIRKPILIMWEGGKHWPDKPQKMLSADGLRDNQDKSSMLPELFLSILFFHVGFIFSNCLSKPGRKQLPVHCYTQTFSSWALMWEVQRRPMTSVMDCLFVHPKIHALKPQSLMWWYLETMPFGHEHEEHMIGLEPL